MRVAMWRRQMVHHSVDQRPRTHRPVAGGHRRAHGMCRGPGQASGRGRWVPTRPRRPGRQSS
eukprot:9112002-Alexandrium_andersonii.AAC.1